MFSSYRPSPPLPAASASCYTNQALAPDGQWYSYERRLYLDYQPVVKVKSDLRKTPSYKTASPNIQKVMMSMATTKRIAERKRLGLHTSCMFDKTGTPLVPSNEHASDSANVKAFRHHTGAHSGQNLFEDETDDEEPTLKKESLDNGGCEEDGNDEDGEEEGTTNQHHDITPTQTSTVVSDASWYAGKAQIPKGRWVTWQERTILDRKALDKRRATLKQTPIYHAANPEQQQTMLEQSEKEGILWRIKSRIHVSCFFKAKDVPWRPYNATQESKAASKSETAVMPHTDWHKRAVPCPKDMFSTEHETSDGDDDDSGMSESDEEEDGDKGETEQDSEDEESEEEDEEEEEEEGKGREETDMSGTSEAEEQPKVLVTATTLTYQEVFNDPLYSVDIHNGQPLGSKYPTSNLLASHATMPPQHKQTDVPCVSRAYGYSDHDELFHVYLPNGQRLDGKGDKKNIKTGQHRNSTMGNGGTTHRLEFVDRKVEDVVDKSKDKVKKRDWEKVGGYAEGLVNMAPYSKRMKTV